MAVIVTVLLVLSVAALIFVALVAGRPRLPAHRLRQPGQEPHQPTMLSAAATVTTGALQKALVGRDTVMSETLTLASLKMKPAELMLWTIVAAVVTGSVGWLAGGLPLAVFGTLAAAAGVFGWVQFRVGRRRQRFDQQMTETLQTLAGALRAGQSLPAAIQMVAEDSDSPTREEFARVVNEVRIGAPMQEALQGVAERTRNEDMLWVVRAIGISTDVGGTLSAVMDGVVQTIQART